MANNEHYRTQLVEDALRSRLVAAREARGWRQHDVAEGLSRDRAFVSDYERGNRRLKMDEFFEVAALLDLDAATLIREVQFSQSN